MWGLPQADGHNRPCGSKGNPSADAFLFRKASCVPPSWAARGDRSALALHKSPCSGAPLGALRFLYNLHSCPQSHAETGEGGFNWVVGV